MAIGEIVALLIIAAAFGGVILFGGVIFLAAHQSKNDRD